MTNGRILRVYNTASRTVEEFQPRHDAVGMYCCGPTVYNYAHIGNLRTYLFEDVLKRILLALGYTVKHVVNITDVGHLTSDADSGEDKMEKGARREGRSVWDIAAHFTETFMRHIRQLNIADADIWPKATDHIGEMIAMVRELENRGFTYRTGDGIYFDTAKFPSYADFARLDVERLRSGARVDMGEKKNPTDFALWKFSPTDAQRQMEWESPWGTGFPGWHIECSAMSLKYLDQPIDIHCGGMDHVRVHHSNEVAQVEAATGKPFVRYWMHGEFLVLEKSKMAKSGDGFITLDKVIERGIDPLAYRLFCFSAHYRSPLTFSWEGLAAAGQSLKNLRRELAGEKKQAMERQAEAAQVERLLEPFYRAVCDDMNMPKAMAAVWDLVRGDVAAVERREAVGRADEILGLDLLKGMEEVVDEDAAAGVRIVSEAAVSDELRASIREKARARGEARKARRFEDADRLRDELTAMGVEMRDLPDGLTECRVSGR